MQMTLFYILVVNVLILLKLNFPKTLNKLYLGFYYYHYYLFLNHKKSKIMLIETIQRLSSTTSFAIKAND